jgi:D-alanyl-lipoteichoic acid acyltransferase DltB (MBOAT superfamily)
MNAPSFAFLGFGVAGAFVYHLLPVGLPRRLLMLVLNLGFFALFLTGPWSALPYLLFLVVGYGAMRAIGPRGSALPFWSAIALILLLFFWLKRYAFMPDAFALGFPYVAIGLSYVFFRLLHLVIEARQGGLAEKPTPLDYLNYALHFPALISGPIQFYPDYRRSERDPAIPLDIVTVGEAGWRIVVGFFKVAILSVALLHLQQAWIAALTPEMPLFPRAATSAAIWAIYPLFLYANFSGYTDFVIGIARLYRFELPENFDNPFVAENFIAFWSRWHITLSNWLKTYVYMPLLMASMRRWPCRRAEAWFGVLAYFVTFFLVGAWHGQTSTFLVFGVLQGGGVAANKVYQDQMGERLGRKAYRTLGGRPFYRALSRGLTYSWFAFTLLWFWSSWGQMAALARTAGPGAVLLGAALVWLVATPALAVLAAITADGRSSWSRSRYVRTAAATAMLLVVLVAQLVTAGPAPDIVYKNF